MIIITWDMTISGRTTIQKWKAHLCKIILAWMNPILVWVSEAGKHNSFIQILRWEDTLIWHIFLLETYIKTEKEAFPLFAWISLPFNLIIPSLVYSKTPETSILVE